MVRTVLGTCACCDLQIYHLFTQAYVLKPSAPFFVVDYGEESASGAEQPFHQKTDGEADDESDRFSVAAAPDG